MSKSLPQVPTFAVEKKNPAVHAITLDVGHTLIHPWPSLGAIYARGAAAHGVHISAMEVEERFPAAWKRCRAGANLQGYGTSFEEAFEFWSAVVAEVLYDREMPAGAFQPMIRDLYNAFARGDAWRMDPHWFTVLHTCRRQGIAIGLISNWDVRLRKVLDEIGLLRQVDAVAISAERGVEKPDPALFNVALSDLGVPAEHVVHAGDSWAEDVEGARSAGVAPVWLNRGACKARVDGVSVINNLEQLVDGRIGLRC